MESIDERWEPIAGCSGYYISNQGRVRYPSGRIVSGRRRCRLKENDGRIRQPYVGQLVYARFGAKTRVNTYSLKHLDGDRNNNAIENLDVASFVKQTVTAEQKEIYEQSIYKIIYAEVRKNHYAKASRDGFDLDATVQDSALRVYRELARYDVNRSFYTFAATIINSVFKSALKKHSKRIKTETAIDEYDVGTAEEES